MFLREIFRKWKKSPIPETPLKEPVTVEAFVKKHKSIFEGLLTGEGTLQFSDCESDVSDDETQQPRRKAIPVRLTRKQQAIKDETEAKIKAKIAAEKKRKWVSVGGGEEQGGISKQTKKIAEVNPSVSKEARNATENDSTGGNLEATGKEVSAGGEEEQGRDKKQTETIPGGIFRVSNKAITEAVNDSGGGNLKAVLKRPTYPAESKTDDSQDEVEKTGEGLAHSDRGVVGDAIQPHAVLNVSQKLSFSKIGLFRGKKKKSLYKKVVVDSVRDEKEFGVPERSRNDAVVQLSPGSPGEEIRKNESNDKGGNAKNNAQKMGGEGVHNNIETKSMDCSGKDEKEEVGEDGRRMDRGGGREGEREGTEKCKSPSEEGSSENNDEKEPTKLEEAMQIFNKGVMGSTKYFLVLFLFEIGSVLLSINFYTPKNVCCIHEELATPWEKNVTLQALEHVVVDDNTTVIRNYTVTQVEGGVHRELHCKKYANPNEMFLDVCDDGTARRIVFRDISIVLGCIFVPLLLLNFRLRSKIKRGHPNFENMANLAVYVVFIAVPLCMLPFHALGKNSASMGSDLQLIICGIFCWVWLYFLGRGNMKFWSKGALIGISGYAFLFIILPLSITICSFSLPSYKDSIVAIAPTSVAFVVFGILSIIVAVRTTRTPGDGGLAGEEWLRYTRILTEECFVVVPVSVCASF